MIATLELFRTDAYARTCSAVILAADDSGIVLDRTVFYPAGGGQPGDSGVLTPHSGGPGIAVSDTQRDADGMIRHKLVEGSVLPSPGTAVEAAIDWERRHRHMRMHTTLHLLCSLVPGSVTGGQVGDERSRLDFDIPAAALDKAALTEALNRLIAEDHPVEALIVDEAELEARPDLVRTLSVKPPTGSGQVRLMQISGIDVQACGGTHVARTGEIGPVDVVKIENKGRQNRRIVVALSRP